MPGHTDGGVVGLMQDADLVFYDASYTDAEMAHFKNYGHSSWEEGVRLARQAGVKRLVLFHHSNKRDDAGLAAIEQQAAEALPGTVAGRTGMRFSLAPASGISAAVSVPFLSPPPQCEWGSTASRRPSPRNEKASTVSITGTIGNRSHG